MKTFLKYYVPSANTLSVIVIVCNGISALAKDKMLSGESVLAPVVIIWSLTLMSYLISLINFKSYKAFVAVEFPSLLLLFGLLSYGLFQVPFSMNGMTKDLVLFVILYTGIRMHLRSCEKRYVRELNAKLEKK